MRVTQSMMSQDLLRQLNQSSNRMSSLQDQLSTGKKITKPSQDPVVATLGIGYRSDVNQTDQYSRNMDEVHKWMDSSDSALDQASSVLQRLYELTVEGSNGTYTPDQRADLEKEVDQLKQQLASVANTQVGDKYIFNGANTTKQPVNINTFQTSYASEDPGEISNQVNIEVNKGIRLQVNVNPADAFPQSLFDDISDLQDALKNGTAADVSEYISTIQGHMDGVTAARADLGARENRADLMDNRLSLQKQVAETIMSKNEDADFEKVLIDFNTEQTIHNAALSVGAKIIQPTLVDFLR